MSRGPAAAPTALKLLKGVRPNRINQNEPKPRSVSGTIPPGWNLQMSDSATRFWKKWAPKLSELGVLTETDLPALRVLCELWSKWVKLTNKVNAGNLTPKMYLSYLRVLNTIEHQMLSYLHHFGMTASSRGNIVVAGSGGDDDEEYLD